MKILRVVFCILACLCVAATVPVGIFYGWYCLFCIAGALTFACAMLLAVRLSAPRTPPSPDFMKSDEENAELNARRDRHE